MKNILRIIIVIILSLYGFSAFAKTVKVGVILPFTGLLAEEAQKNLDGHKFAVDEINASGGIRSLGGAKLVLLLGDSRGDPSIGCKEAERLIKEGAVALTGPYQSSVAYITSEVAEKHEIPFVISTALADILTSRGLGYTFRVEPKISDFVEAQYNFLIENGIIDSKGKGRVALLYESTLWGQTTAQFQREYAKKKKINIVADVAYPYNLKDISTVTNSVVDKLKVSEADVILQASYLHDSIELARAMKKAGLKPKAVIGTGAGSKDPGFVEALGFDAENFMVLNEWSKDINRPGAIKLNAAFRKQYGYDMNGIAAVSYAAIWIIKEAIEKSGSLDGKEIRMALVKLNLNHGPATILPKGRVYFDSEGNNVAYPIVSQIINGENKVVWPVEVASSKPIFDKYFIRKE